MVRWGLLPDIQVEKLIRAHQVRFYPTSKKRTYRSFLLELGQGQLKRFIDVLKADRVGNRANLGKPIVTHEMSELFFTLTKLDFSQFYLEELDIPEGMYVSWKHRRELAALCQLDRRRNQQVYLLNKLETWDE